MSRANTLTAFLTVVAIAVLAQEPPAEDGLPKIACRQKETIHYWNFETICATDWDPMMEALAYTFTFSFTCEWCDLDTQCRQAVEIEEAALQITPSSTPCYGPPACECWDILSADCEVHLICENACF